MIKFSLTCIVASEENRLVGKERGFFNMNKTYKLTVFDASGEKLLDEAFTAENDQQAKELGQSLLNEKQYQDHTHRCTSSSGTLLLFHR